MRIAALLAGVFLSRLTFVAIVWKVSGHSGFLTNDSPAYLSLAQSLLHGSFSEGGVAHIARTPGYPLFLLPAVVFQHPVLIGIVENLLLAVGSAWLIWRIVESLFPGSAASTWAVLLYCFEPIGLLYTAKIMSETLFSAALLLFLWLVIRFLREPTYGRLILAALVLSCATYARPASMYLGVFLIPVFLFFPRSLPLIHRVFRAVAFPVVFALTLLPWQVRNAAVAGYPGLSTVSDLALYFYSAGALQAKLEHKGFLEQQAEMGFLDDQRYFQVHPEQKTWSRGQISLFQGAEAKRLISQHLPSYLIIHVRGLPVLFGDTLATVILQTLRLYPERGGLLARTIDQGVFRGMLWLIHQHPLAGATFLFLLVQLLLYYVLALLGVRHFPVGIICLFGSVALYFILVSAGPLANGRYRAPIMLFVCISAGVAIANRGAARHPKRSCEVKPSVSFVAER